jgi:PTH1 family peptidyl-tRNA hydrolase
MAMESEPSSESNRAGPPDSPVLPVLPVLVGLGNPGEEYRATRHNIGFRVVEAVAARRGLVFDGEECRSRIAESEEVLLVLPQSYMNRSGYALRCLAERRDLSSEAMLVVYDEVHLPLGRLRLRKKGGPGGHRGMESVVENLRTAEVPRLRCGVGPEEGELAGEDLVEFVLGPFQPEENEAVEAMIERAADACEAWLDEGLNIAMNRFNG